MVFFPFLYLSSWPWENMSLVSRGRQHVVPVQRLWAACLREGEKVLAPADESRMSPAMLASNRASLGAIYTLATVRSILVSKESW